MTLANPLGPPGPAIDQTSLCYLQHAEGEGVVRRGSDIFLYEGIWGQVLCFRDITGGGGDYL